MMTDELDLNDRCTVLEIGTGSGYQTAYLARFARWVYTVERIAELSQQARKHLDTLGFMNIDFRIADGKVGLPDFAPFDRIMVTAAPSEIPQPLIDQLNPGGIMIIPVGPSGFQQLVKVHKGAAGRITSKKIADVAFVPLV